MTRAFIGFGSNLGDRAAHFRWALKRLESDAEFKILRTSRFRETIPEGDGYRAPFLNAVVAVETSLTPRALLASLLDWEIRRGRVRPLLDRPLDLDLLLYGSVVLEEPDLILPHPRMEDRRFVLEPLAEIAPNVHIPNGATPSACLQKLQRN